MGHQQAFPRKDRWLMNIHVFGGWGHQQSCNNMSGPTNPHLPLQSSVGESKSVVTVVCQGEWVGITDKVSLVTYFF